MNKHTREIDEDVHAAFCMFIDTHKVSQAQLARDLGISPAAVSTYRSKTYQANAAAIEEKIKALLLREKSPRPYLPSIPQVSVRSFSDVQKALALSHNMGEMAVIVGDAGTGKSTALRKYAVNNKNTLLVEVDPSTTTQSLVRGIARILGLSDRGSFSSLSEAIVDNLCERDMLLIFDEADYLSERCLQWIRRVVHDKGKSAVALCGLSTLEGALHKVRGEYDQLVSRVGVFVRVKRASIADTRKLIGTFWPNADSAVVNTVHAKSRGSVRRIVKIMHLANNIARSKHEEIPSVQTLEEAANHLMVERELNDINFVAQHEHYDV